MNAPNRAAAILRKEGLPRFPHSLTRYHWRMSSDVLSEFEDWVRQLSGLPSQPDIDQLVFGYPIFVDPTAPRATLAIEADS